VVEIVAAVDALPAESVSEVVIEEKLLLETILMFAFVPVGLKVVVLKLERLWPTPRIICCCQVMISLFWRALSRRTE
jgi:hypothetical protein